MSESINTTFCRLMYHRVMEVVKQRFSTTTIRCSWVYKVEEGKWEFHINKCPEFPDGFYWYGEATNSWDAKVHGWSEALEKGR